MNEPSTTVLPLSNTSGLQAKDDGAIGFFCSCCSSYSTTKDTCSSCDALIDVSSIKHSDSEQLVIKGVKALKAAVYLPLFLLGGALILSSFTSGNLGVFTIIFGLVLLFAGYSIVIARRTLAIVIALSCGISVLLFSWVVLNFVGALLSSK